MAGEQEGAWKWECVSEKSPLFSLVLDGRRVLQNEGVRWDDIRGRLVDNQQRTEWNFSLKTIFFEVRGEERNTVRFSDVILGLRSPTLPKDAPPLDRCSLEPVSK